jgi:hypothetical protein
MLFAGVTIVTGIAHEYLGPFHAAGIFLAVLLRLLTYIAFHVWALYPRLPYDSFLPSKLQASISNNVKSSYTVKDKCLDISIYSERPGPFVVRF